MTPKTTPAPEPTVDPASISRALLEKRATDLEAEFAKAVQLRDQAAAQAKQYDLLALRIEGAITVMRELLAPSTEQ